MWSQYTVNTISFLSFISSPVSCLLFLSITAVYCPATPDETLSTSPDSPPRASSLSRPIFCSDDCVSGPLAGSVLAASLCLLNVSHAHRHVLLPPWWQPFHYRQEHNCLITQEAICWRMALQPPPEWLQFGSKLYISPLWIFLLCWVAFCLFVGPFCMLYSSSSISVFLFPRDMWALPFNSHLRECWRSKVDI